jgi:hypothetical protein
MRAKYLLQSRDFCGFVNRPLGGKQKTVSKWRTIAKLDDESEARERFRRCNGFYGFRLRYRGQTLDQKGW